ncbi:hypothetical protein BD414DRAFT_577387, partial [Trametes punicea]
MPWTTAKAKADVTCQVFRRERPTPHPRALRTPRHRRGTKSIRDGAPASARGKQTSRSGLSCSVRRSCACSRRAWGTGQSSTGSCARARLRGCSPPDRCRRSSYRLCRRPQSTAPSRPILGKLRYSTLRVRGAGLAWQRHPCHTRMQMHTRIASSCGCQRSVTVPRTLALRLSLEARARPDPPDGIA